MFICKKKSSSLLISLRFPQILQTCQFGLSGHDQPCPLKLIISTCRNGICLSKCKISTSFLPSLLRYCKLFILGTLGTPGRSYQIIYIESFDVHIHEHVHACEIKVTKWFFILDYSGKNNDKTFKNTLKTPSLAHFAHLWEKQNFPQNSVLTSFC